MSGAKCIVPVPGAFAPFWGAFMAGRGEEVSQRFYEATYFGDAEATADHLAALVLEGTKRATATLVWGLEHEGKRLPRPGDLSIVTNWAREPLCVIETQSVRVVPFDHVTEAFAAAEGEGDASLSYWRDAHWAYYGRECLRIGREPAPWMPVVCEQFAVIYRSKG